MGTTVTKCISYSFLCICVYVVSSVLVTLFVCVCGFVAFNGYEVGPYLGSTGTKDTSSVYQ